MFKEAILAKVYKQNQPDKAIMAYIILDDQSNRSLAGPELFSLLHLKGNSSEYKLTSCAGTMNTFGRRATGLVIESLDGSTSLQLPTLIECDIPNIREEIPSPAVVRHHDHLREIADYIPEIDDTAPILLLIGRDLPEAHHVIEQLTGPTYSPYAQKLRLGWVIVGETCLNQFHRPDTVTVNKTYLLRNGRSSICKPCPNNFEIKENLSADSFDTNCYISESESEIFARTNDDDTIGMSIEDKEFLQIMDQTVSKDAQGDWEAPLPFRSPKPKLPNNRLQVLRRAKSLDFTLRKNDVKREHFLAFMKKIFDNNHAEIAPALSDGEESWYLPIFGVYHPKKPTQIRVVFDSSAKYDNTSLNDVLITGPDLVNSLVGVLLRFRKDLVAITADIQQMFYCFVVSEKHRNFLRFFWYKDNDPQNELIEYRMRVHVFGNSPSPAVATYGLRKTAQSGEEIYGSDVLDFVNRNFYVDDGLMSLPTAS
ncbi:Hypothetical predicted protein [Mytilus galloprovincialis]|uniref:Peptidase aspartic putative domain-containing protein n=1 Tax=Mytilus galloprovincialis TaxID=29158 RepID=A0A8B6HFZ7_MYTGA|nr:Hypothetical predicted protein [Mytilus galloprovincialis]